MPACRPAQSSPVLAPSARVKGGEVPVVVGELGIVLVVDAGGEDDGLIDPCPGRLRQPLPCRIDADRGYGARHGRIDALVDDPPPHEHRVPGEQGPLDGIDVTERVARLRPVHLPPAKGEEAGNEDDDGDVRGDRPVGEPYRRRHGLRCTCALGGLRRLGGLLGGCEGRTLRRRACVWRRRRRRGGPPGGHGAQGSLRDVRAVVIDNGGVSVAERPDPLLGDEQILVEVRAAGLNGADLLQAQGLYPPPPGVPVDLPGLEYAGEVAAVGSAVSRFQVGDRVMGLVAGAAQAELVTVHERLAMPVPEGMRWVEAGGFPEAFATAYDALFVQADLGAGERLLVQGAAGGVGLAAVQLGVAAGARVTATVRDPLLRPALEEIGADAVPPDAYGARAPFDVVVELVGGSNIAGDLAALANGGRICVIGIASGARVDLDLRQLMERRAVVRGSTLRARSIEEKALLARELEARVVPMVASGRVRVPVFAVFPLAAADEAYRRFAAGGKLGKIVLAVSTVDVED